MEVSVRSVRGHTLDCGEVRKPSLPCALQGFMRGATRRTYNCNASSSDKPRTHPVAMPHDSQNQHVLRAGVFLIGDCFVQGRIEGLTNASDPLDSPPVQPSLNSATAESHTAHPGIVGERLGYLSKRPLEIVEEWQKLAHERDTLLFPVHRPFLFDAPFEAQEVRPLMTEQLQQLRGVKSIVG